MIQQASPLESLSLKLICVGLHSLLLKPWRGGVWLQCTAGAGTACTHVTLVLVVLMGEAEDSFPHVAACLFLK